MDIIRRHTDYGLRGLITIASASNGAPAFVSDVSKQIGVSKDFLYKIFGKLSRAGIIRSHRGVKGGFSMVRNPDDLSVFEIVEVIQGPLTVNRCLLRSDACPNYHGCNVSNVLRSVQKNIVEALEKVKLSDLIKEQAKNGS